MPATANLSGELTLVHIEDDHAWCEFVRKVVLEHAAVKHCGQAFTGGEGLARCREINPDIVLLDLGLPDGDGFALVAPLSAVRIPPPALCCSPVG